MNRDSKKNLVCMLRGLRDNGSGEHSINKNYMQIYFQEINKIKPTKGLESKSFSRSY